MSTCVACGKPVESGVSYCPSCGSPVAAVTAGQKTSTAPVFGDLDRQVLRKLRVFSIIFLLVAVGGFVAGLGVNLFSLSSAFSHAGASGGTGLPSAASLSAIFIVLVASLVASGVVEIAAFLQLRSAFRILAGLAPGQFTTAGRFTTLLILSAPFLYLGLILVLAGIWSFLPSVVGATNLSPQSYASSLFASSGFGYLIAGLVLTLVSGIAALVGFLGGLMQGLWRLGVRYNSDTIRAGSILFIIPVLVILAPILVLVGVGSASMNLEATGKP